MSNAWYADVPSAADTGDLVAVPMGPTQAVPCVRPSLQGMITRPVIDWDGREVGMGSLTKTMGNAFVFTSIETVSECLVLEEKWGSLGGGIRLPRWMDVMFPGSLAHYAIRMTSGDYWALGEPLS